VGKIIGFSDIKYFLRLNLEERCTVWSICQNALKFHNSVTPIVAVPSTYVRSFVTNCSFSPSKMQTADLFLVEESRMKAITE